ncbi:MULTISPECIES: RIP metalloprotease RseP [Rhizobium]|uniref:Regulator of sigma E protease n=1 Tax=Rhizobium lusitanum TaxID=293958 RepID=A0A1C3VFN1_9HYPH|nr:MULTISPECIES: RIP metalloprotease RseP [Rhizobium]NKJ34625.1 regulator of sigma E protease [Rhizobium sp. SG570]SCB26592.1 regulator of sigma E protease [Rhizobium lusitanum]
MGGAASFIGFLTNNVITFVFVLSLLVFVHEMGHYLVGRWSGIRIMAFSIGFGPEILGHTDRHGTRWKLSLIPLGGYVRFFGDEDASSKTDTDQLAAMTEEERAQSFAGAKLWKRAATVAAGPIANFILAIAIFAVLFSVYGRTVADPVVAMVTRDGAAAEAGIEPGDRLMAIDGVKVKTFDEVQRYVGLRPGRTIVLTVERDGQMRDFRIMPKLVEDTDQFGNKMEMGRIGIALVDPLITGVEPNGPAAKAGIVAGDRLIAADGNAIATYYDIGRYIGDRAGKSIVLTIQRNGEIRDFPIVAETLTETDASGNKKDVGSIGIAPIDPLVASIAPDSPAEAAGLELGDRILSVDGQAVGSISEVQRYAASHADKPVALSVERGGQTRDVTVTPKKSAETDIFGAQIEIATIGITDGQKPIRLRYEAYGPFQALGEGVKQTGSIVSGTFEYIANVIGGYMKADQLGGPIRVAQLSGQMATLGFSAVLQFAAILSVSIGLLNLMPVPVLDGGHLMFYAIEAVRGKPLGARAQDIAFRIGFAMVLSLMVFATWNDISSRIG